MTDYPIGTVAIATVRGVPDVQIMRMNDTAYEWISSALPPNYSRWLGGHEVEDIRVVYTPPLGEPAEFGARVTDKHGVKWLRFEDGNASRAPWASQDARFARWSKIEEPRLGWDEDGAA